MIAVWVRIENGEPVMAPIENQPSRLSEYEDRPYWSRNKRGWLGRPCTIEAAREDYGIYIPSEFVTGRGGIMWSPAQRTWNKMDTK